MLSRIPRLRPARVHRVPPWGAFHTTAARKKIFIPRLLLWGAVKLRGFYCQILRVSASPEPCRACRARSDSATPPRSLSSPLAAPPFSWWALAPNSTACPSRRGCSWPSLTRTSSKSSRKAYRELIEDGDMKRSLLPPEHEDTLLVARIVERLLAVATEEMQGREFEWRVHVVDSPDEVNAFVLPNGAVFVYTGLLQTMHRNVDALAFVLAHEMAHTLARHAAEKSLLSMLVAVGDLATSVLVALLFDFSNAFYLFNADSFRSNVISSLLNSPYSQMLETEADFIGLTLASRACFAPRAAAEVWKWFAQHEARSSEERDQELAGERQWQKQHWPAHPSAPAPVPAGPGAEAREAESAEASAQGPSERSVHVEEFPASGERSLLEQVFSTHPSHRTRYNNVMLWQELAAREQEGKRCEVMQASWWKAVQRERGGGGLSRRFWSMMNRSLHAGDAQPGRRVVPDKRASDPASRESGGRSGK